MRVFLQRENRTRLDDQLLDLEAVGILEAAYEKPVDEVFKRFDVEPFAAAWRCLGLLSAASGLLPLARSSRPKRPMGYLAA